MAREQTLYDIPDEWKENLRVGHCWCGKPRAEFDKRQKIYCSQEHADEYGKRVKIWSIFKNNFLEKCGRTCSICGMTEEQWDKQEQAKEIEFYNNLVIEYKDAIEFERARKLVELQKQLDKINDDAEILKDMSWHTREAFDIPQGYDSRFHKEHFQIEVDHINAVSLGGDMWDENNLRPLCNSCHKVKTKEDMHKLKFARKAKGTEKLIDSQ